MTRIRPRLAAVALIVAVPTVLAACGGSSESPEDVLHQTFSNDAHVTSGNLDVSITVAAQGQQGGNLTASLSGPFQGNGTDTGTFPQFALTAKATGDAAGQKLNFEGGLTATADQAFVNYGGTTYEVPKQVYDSFKQAYQQQAQAAQAAQTGSTSTSTTTPSPSAVFSQLGIDPSSWITNVSDEGDADVGGTTTVHIHGDADVTQILNDFVKIAQSTPGASLPSGFDPSQLGLLSGFVQNATVDVYSGKDDHILRKLELKLTVTPPGGAGGVTSVDVDFAITLTGVNETQTISAPSGPTKPLSDLLRQFGVNLGSLGSLGSLPSGSLPGVGSGSSGGASGQSLQNLQSCVANAGADITKINSCYQKYGGG